ncbi:MAG: hypothetical protein JRI52_08730 [Deltaproteobacteria bacterium]|nr:hypothetical protein [Deltaproteobacteria bacterium]
MDQKERIQALNKRLTSECKAEQMTPLEKGRIQGKKDAFDFSFVEFMEYREILNKYTVDGIGDINGGEPGLEIFYVDVRNRMLMMLFSINPVL